MNFLAANGRKLNRIPLGGITNVRPLVSSRELWRAGGWAFEEYSALKSFPTRGKQISKSGRVDIMFGLHKVEYVAEAKQCWPNLADPQRAKLVALDSLGLALLDSSRVPYQNIPHLGISFITPKLHISKQADIDKLLEQFISQLLNIPNASVAWIFPKLARNLRPNNQYKNFIFPGVAVLIRTARRVRLKKLKL